MLGSLYHPWVKETKETDVCGYSKYKCSLLPNIPICHGRIHFSLFTLPEQNHGNTTESASDLLSASTSSSPCGSHIWKLCRILNQDKGVTCWASQVMGGETDRIWLAELYVCTCERVTGDPSVFNVVTVLLSPVTLLALIKGEFIPWALHFIQQNWARSLPVVSPWQGFWGPTVNITDMYAQ